MLKRFLMIAAMAFFSISSNFPHEGSLPQKVPLKIIEQNQEILKIDWQIPEIVTDQVEEKGQKSWRVSFDQCDFSALDGNYKLPFKRFSIGIPENATVSYELSDIVYETRNNIIVTMSSRPGRDKNGISITAEPSGISQQKFVDRAILEISDQVYFRDMPLVHISFYPVRYDPAAKNLRIIKSATITFRFKNGKNYWASYVPRSKIDYLYKKMVLNFDQARNWLAGRPGALKKSITSFAGPWYKIEVNEDGLYKINSTTLSAAGIDVANIDPRTFRLYNHGGKPLNPNTTSLIDNPEGPLETAIYVSGEEDGRFDSGDYLLFYGTGAGGWYFSETANKFAYIQHPYDTKNYYWLTFGNGAGKRMPVQVTPVAGTGMSDTYFIEKVHFEEDKYNLLASGADWYGYRFYGKSHNVSLDYTINNLSPAPNQAEMVISFKGGSGLKYLDDDNYQYYFTAWINPDKATSPIFSSYYLREEKSAAVQRSFVSTDYLQEGLNSVYIQYTGNYENCNAYLDWVEFYYPREYTAKDNQLIFYTQSTGQTISYTISGFSSTEALLFDITDPVNVNLLQTESSVQGGNYSFHLDLSDNRPRRLIASSATSGAIKNISGLVQYHPTDNLMDPMQSTDLLIITDPSFRSYASEIVTLRANEPDPIRGKVINLNDIYFYFGSGVKDVVAIRNFIRYAYYNWSSPQPAYVLLFGDGHYDYRNIAIPDTNRVPPFEITAFLELDSRETDNFYVDVNFASNSFSSIQPDLAIGRMPVESKIDARRIVDKLKSYAENKQKDGWQTMLTFVADDNKTSTRDTEWFHQRDTESLANIFGLRKFLNKKIYLSAYESVPGGFGRVKPKANQAIIDQLNEGTLLINYAGHGSPTAWAHESALDMTRDMPRIQNEGRLPLWIAATCDFGKYDDPHDPSFSEALVWEEERGAIAVISSSRLVYAGSNIRFNRALLANLFPSGAPSRRLGEVMLMSTLSNTNDQKYHLFGDPTMYLADPRGQIRITDVSPDTLKALSKVSVTGIVSDDGGGEKSADFTGGAYLIVNDARYDSVNTGGPYDYTLFGPRIFKGEISVDNGSLKGEFIVPKSIRYHKEPTGRVTIFAWNEEGYGNAMGYVDTLLFKGTSDNLSDAEGPDVSLYFDDQEDFRDGDMVKRNSVLSARITDENGINLTQEIGHKIEITIDDKTPLDITSFFAYDRNSYSEGELSYHLDAMDPGDHHLKIQAWDNLNNPTSEEITFQVVDAEGLVLENVVNYPNPFSDETSFTFQLLGSELDTEVLIKVYTVTGRLVRSMESMSPPADGFNYYSWDGRDDDGDIMANGVYLYKVIVKNETELKEVIEKLVILR